MNPDDAMSFLAKYILNTFVLPFPIGFKFFFKDMVSLEDAVFVHVSVKDVL